MSLSKASKLLVNYRRLMNTKRCNNFSVVHDEDVAHHSYYVTLIAVLVAKDCNKSIAEHNSKLHHYDPNAVDIFDITSIYEKGMFHDVEEAFISDIPRNIKHHSKEVNEAIENAVSEKLQQIFDGSGVTGEYALEHNLSAKNGREGKLIDIIDMLELAIYCAEECCCGNEMMYPLLTKAVKLIEENSIFDDMMKWSPVFKELYELLSSGNILMVSGFQKALDID